MNFDFVFIGKVNLLEPVNALYVCPAILLHLFEDTLLFLTKITFDYFRCFLDLCTPIAKPVALW